MTTPVTPEATPVITDPVAPITPSSEELKPLTDAELASMTTEQITAHAEKLEEQVKSGKQTPDQIRENQTKRLKNVQEKAFGSTTEPTSTPQGNEIAQADILTLAKTNFEIGSPEQKLLQERVKQGVIKSYSEGMSHVGVKAEIEAITASRNAATVIDENDTEGVLKTKKEAIAQARASGEVPEDPALRKAIVEDNISRMKQLG